MGNEGLNPLMLKEIVRKLRFEFKPSSSRLGSLTTTPQLLTKQTQAREFGRDSGQFRQSEQSKERHGENGRQFIR